MNFIRYAVVLLAAATAHADVLFGPVKNYPNIGFSFPCLANAKADPVPMPRAHADVFQDERELTREDRFAPAELWYEDQCCARWRDVAGNSIVLARMSRLLPDFSDAYVSREQFKAALADTGNSVSPDNKTDINDWVASFVDAPVYEPNKLKINAFSLDEVRAFPCGVSNTLVYAFKPRSTGNAKSFDWFCVTLKAAGAIDAKVLKKTFEDQFIGKISVPNRSSASDGVQSKEVTTSSEEETAAAPLNSDIAVAARKSIENYDDWWHAETEGYIILSDVYSEIGKSIIREIKASMPALRKAYEKLVPPFTSAREVSLIRMFESREDYVRYVGKEYGWTGGVWMSDRRELVLTMGKTKEETMRTIRHEAFHQYLSEAYCMIPSAPWMNEGHACFFENASVNARGRVRIDEDPRLCPLLVDNIEQAVTFIPLIVSEDYADFYSGTAAERDLKYALAWGLVYYLQKGAPQERNTPFKTLLCDYAGALARDHAYDKATRQSFGQIDMPVFQDNFREFWLKRRASALQFDPLDN